MKTRNLFLIGLVTLLFSGCIVYSFYPLYTEKDLFPNDILTGQWVDDEGTLWDFKHPYLGKKELGNIDSTSYLLTVKMEEEEKKSLFSIHLVKLGGHYFLDFYLEELPVELGEDLSSLHIIPVHTFAKLTLEENKLIINWFDQEWLQELIEENKIRIHHEETDELILLTAKPKELQKFVTKYVNSEEAFKDGLEAILYRK